MAIKIKIVADYDQRGMTKATKALDNFAKQAQIALGAVAVATAALAVKSVQEFAKFEGAMTKSLAIMGNVSDAMRDEMSNAAREMAKTTTFSAEQAADSYFFLASAGLDAEASVAALPRVASFAQAGMFDMARATDLLTDAQSALGLTIRDDAVANMENMARVSDVLVKANTLANASVEQFSTSLTTKAGASLRALGKDVEEGVAVLAAFADQGIKGELAGTQLSIVLRDLTTKAIDNKEAFEAAGLSIFDSNGEMRNMGDIVANLETLLSGMSDEVQKATLLQLGFSDRSLGSLQALLGTSEAIKLYEAELRNASGTTDEIANKQLESFNAQLALLESALIDVFIEIGEQLTPALKDLVGQIRDLLPELGTKLVEAIKKVDFARIVEDFGNFVVLIVENIDTIGKVATGLLYAAGALATYRIATQLATTATALLNSTLILNPFALLAAGIVVTSVAMTNFHYELKRAREEATGLDGRLAEIYAEFGRLKELVDAGVISFKDYTAQINPLIAELARLEGQFGATTGEANRFNNLKLSSARAEIYATAEATAALNEASRQYGLARMGLLTGEASGRGAEVLAALNTPISTGPSAFEQARERVQDLIKRSQKQLADAQERYNKTVKQADQNYADSVARLQEEFGNRLAGIIQQSQDRLRNAYKAAVQVNLSTLFERDEDKSVTGLVKGLSDKLAASKQLLSNSAELASAGFSQTFIEQVVAAGTETGNELAQAILQSTPETQRELQDLFVALEQTSNSGMDQLAASIYEKQGLATQALKDLYLTTEMELAEALLDQQDQLAQALEDAAAEFRDSVLDIRDSVTEAVGDMDGQLGGLNKTVDQFLAKLERLTGASGELEKATAVSAPVTTGGGSVAEAIVEAVEEVAEAVEEVVGGGGGGGRQIDIPEPLTPGQLEALKADAYDPRVGNVINVNVKTDPTQSPAQVGGQVAKTIQKYFTGGGGIKVIAL